MREPTNEPNLNPKPETESERPEYNFEEGVEQVMRSIEQLLQTQDIVVIGIAGPISDDVGVGKSTLKDTIHKRLLEARVPCVSTDQFNYFNAGSVTNLDLYKTEFGADKAVVIFGAIGFGVPEFTESQVKLFKELQDSQLQTTSANAGLPIEHIDIRILICRSDQPTSDTNVPVADMIIRNQYTTRSQQ